MKKTNLISKKSMIVIFVLMIFSMVNLVQAYYPADLNQDGYIGISDLMNYIGMWKNNEDVSIAQLIEVISIWKRGDSIIACLLCKANSCNHNGIAEAGEACDGTDMQGADCIIRGLNSGTLGCDNNCDYDTSTCTNTICGDTICNGDETCSTCPADCGACAPVCGDTICNGDETCSTCPTDCGTCAPSCGDTTCDVDETCSNCPDDCGACDSCTDTDGGNTITLAGTVSGYLNDVYYSHSDTCVDSSNVREYYCSSTSAQSSQQSCGTDTSTLYCNGDLVIEDAVDYFCSSGACGSTPSTTQIENCNSYDTYGPNYCMDRNVYRNHNDYSCSSGACSSSTVPTLVETCNYDCSTGSCISPADYAVTRQFSKITASPNEVITVHLYINPGSATYYSVDDLVPSEFTIVSGSTSTGNHIKIVELDAVAIVYDYTIRVPSSTGSYTFTGIYQIEGMEINAEILGETTLTIS